MMKHKINEERWRRNWVEMIEPKTDPKEVDERCRRLYGNLPTMYEEDYPFKQDKRKKEDTGK